MNEELNKATILSGRRIIVLSEVVVLVVVLCELAAVIAMPT